MQSSVEKYYVLQGTINFTNCLISAALGGKLYLQTTHIHGDKAGFWIPAPVADLWQGSEQGREVGLRSLCASRITAGEHITWLRAILWVSQAEWQASEHLEQGKRCTQLDRRMGGTSMEKHQCPLLLTYALQLQGMCRTHTMDRKA